jgi:hypothetical protein
MFLEVQKIVSGRPLSSIQINYAKILFKFQNQIRSTHILSLESFLQITNLLVNVPVTNEIFIKTSFVSEMNFHVKFNNQYTDSFNLTDSEYLCFISALTSEINLVDLTDDPVSEITVFDANNFITSDLTVI